MNDHLRVLAAFMVVASSVVGAVAIGGQAGGPIGEAIDSVSPVGEADALIVATCYFTGALGGEGCGVSEQEALEQEDALETHKEIYTALAGVEQQQSTLLTSFENSGQDSDSVALMIGKNAYIRALNNGTVSTQAEAEAAATGAVADYYSTRQLNLISGWNATALSIEGSRLTVENTSGLSVGDAVQIAHLDNTSVSDHDIKFTDATDLNEPSPLVTLANGTDARPLAYIFKGGNIDFTDQPVSVNTGGGLWTGISVQNATVNNVPFQAVDFDRYSNAWTDLENQNSAVQSQLETFVSNTYSSYEAGDINSSDLVDPYVANRDYSPDDEYGAWAMRSLSSMGISPPEDLDGFGDMTIDYDGQTYSGILLSDGLPSNDTFETGVTYDTATLDGSQYIMDPYGENLVQMDGTFEIVNATTMDGEKQSSVEYRSIDYETETTDEYEQTLNDLQNTTEQINARQQELRSGGGGGIVLPDFGIGGLGSGLAGLVVVGGVIYLLTRRRD